jgi:hypothetical protein
MKCFMVPEFRPMVLAPSTLSTLPIEKVPPTPSRNVLLLIGIREFVAHFGKLVKEGVNDFLIRGES